MAADNAALQILLELVDKASPELSKFRKEFEKTSGDVSKQADNMAKSTDTASTKMGAAFTRLAVPIAAVTAAFSALAWGMNEAFKSAERVDELADMGAKYGYTADQVAILDRAVKDAGGSLEAVESTYAKVAASLAKTGDDAGKASDAYKRLGIATEDVNGNTRSFVEVAQELSKKMLEGGLSAQQYADLQTVAGKSIKENALSIIAAAEAMKYANEMYQQGIGITQESQDAASNLESVNAKLSFIYDVIGSQLAQIVIPTFIAIKQAMYDSYINGGLMASAVNILKGAMSALIVVIQTLSAILTGFDAVVAISGKSIGAFFASLDAALSAPWGKKAEAFKNVWKNYATDVAKIANDAANNIRKMTELPTSSGTLLPPKGAKAAPADDTATKAKKTQEEWERYLKNLREEYDQLGMSTHQKMLYKIETIAAEMANKKQAAAFKASATALAEKINVWQQEQEKAKENNRIVDEALAAEEKQRLEIENGIKSLRLQVEQMEYENTLIGLTNEERERAILLRELENKHIDITTEGMKALVDRYQEALRIKREATEVDSLLKDTEVKKTEELQRKVDLLNKAYFDGINGVKLGDVEYEQAMNKLLGKTEQTTNEVSEFWKEAARSMQNAMSSFFFDIMQGKIDSLGASFKRMIDKMVADYMASELSKILFGDITSKGSSSGGGMVQAAAAWFGGLFRAGGGPVSSGAPYIVGEVGPELFVPSSSGTIVPTSQTQNMLGKNVTFNITAMDSQSVIAALDKIKRPLAEMVNGTNRSYNLAGAR